MSATQSNISSNSSTDSKNLLVIDEEETSAEYGKYPSRRTVEDLLDYGFITLDKPPAPTSHEVVAWIRRMLKVKRAGHSGTLDPMVTGLLPVGLGEATKALSVLLMGPKEYFGIARFHGSVEDDTLRKVFREFIGEIYQKPPQRSSVRRTTRLRRIYELEIIETKGRLILFRVLCQAGTYVRKLIYDIGEVTMNGATMIELRRSKVSDIEEKNGLVSLHDLADAVFELKENESEEKIRRLIQPVEKMVSSLKSIIIKDSAIASICYGAQLAIPGILKLSPNIIKGDTVAIYSLKGELVAIAEAIMSTKEIEDADKGIAVQTKRVIMKQDTYPRLWKKKSQNAGVA